MERLFLTFAMWSSMAFADAGGLVAAEAPIVDAKVIEASAAGETFVLSAPVGIDPIITGSSVSTVPKGALHLIDGCDAACQAQQLGLVFDD